MELRPTIGLEIHVELKTKTKMFCGCLNNPDEKEPNKNICPICLGHPGTLPVINKKAVESVLKLGLALNSEIPEISKFDRKNYFYPDLPKGYQISQYDKPLAIGGELNGVKLRRIHLEEDTARLLHASGSTNNELRGNGSRIQNSKFIIHNSSLVDFNRAGVPLMELVTEPEIQNGREAVTFAKELRLILRYLGISDADMEKGQMRVEANVSVSKDHKLGTKAEVKNLNSFRSVGEAIDYEIKRQEKVLEKGDVVRHETRGWDDIKKITVSQRVKEEAHDYRYFPEPDLPILRIGNPKSEILNSKQIQNSNSQNSKLAIPIFNLEKLKAEIPELPAQKRKRFSSQFNLKPEQIEVLIGDIELARYFEDAAKELKSQIPNPKYQILLNYFTSDLLGLMAEQKLNIGDLKMSPKYLAELTALIIENKISSRIAKDVLREMFLTGSAPGQIIQKKGLSQISNEKTIKKAIKEVINENPKAVEDYKKGKEASLQFLFGRIMAKLKGRANPDVLKTLLQEELRKPTS